jgi:hypothetical protein
VFNKCNKQLLNEVEYDIENYQGRGLCHLPTLKADVDNTNREALIILDIIRKPNSIIVLLYIASFGVDLEKLQNSCQFNGVFRIISLFLFKIFLFVFSLSFSVRQ